MKWSLKGGGSKQYRKKHKDENNVALVFEKKLRRRKNFLRILNIFEVGSQMQGQTSQQQRLVNPEQR
jgi:hypothetical protein